VGPTTARRAGGHAGTPACAVAPGASLFALVLAASVLAFAAILAVWVNRQALNTDNWTTSSSRMLESPAVRDQLAAYLVDQLYANVDVEAQIREALPPRAQPLAGPAAGFLRERIDLRARETTQQHWEDADRAAHQALMRVIDGDVHSVELDVKALLEQTGDQTGIRGRVAGALPADAARITILRPAALRAGLVRLGGSTRTMAGTATASARARGTGGEPDVDAEDLRLERLEQLRVEKARILCSSCSPPSATDGRSGDGLSRAERRAQVLLLVPAERALQDGAAVGLHPVDDLVARVRAAEEDQCRGAGLERLAEILHEVVAHAEVGHLAPDGSRCGADGHAEERGQEDQADQAAPHGAARGAGAGGADRLVELDLAVGLAFDDHRVLEREQMLLRGLDELLPHLLGGVAIRIGDGDEGAHC
jgi:hypothetical protein